MYDVALSKWLDSDRRRIDDESFKFRALSAGAVMAFDGQTELHLSRRTGHISFGEIRSSELVSLHLVFMKLVVLGALRILVMKL